jgi:hypothetical protein
MNRRWFLARVAALGPLIVITPELVEALTPKRVISLPPWCKAGPTPPAYDPRFRPQYFAMERAAGPGHGMGGEPKPLLVGGLTERLNVAPEDHQWHPVEHRLTSQFYASPEHLRRKKYLNCVNGQMVWVPYES